MQALLLLFNNKTDKTKKYLLLALIPVIFITFLICTNGANVPYIDDWSLVPVLQHIHNGTFGWSDLWAQHYEHRIFFPNLVTIALARITYWNLFVEMLLNVLLAAGILLLLFRYIQKTARTQAWSITTVVATSAILFSPVQWENWLWGWQIGWYMCMFFGILALGLLDRTTTWLTDRWRYILAALCCVIATYSLASGMFFWVACVVPLALRGHSRRRVVAWTLFSAASVGLYFYNFQFNSLGISAPAEYARFFFAFLGNTLGHNVPMAILFGILLLGVLIVAIYLARRQQLPLANLALPFGLTVFVVLSAVMASLGRAPINGSEGALLSRYAALSCMLIIAILLIVMQLSWQRTMLRATIVVLVMLLLSNYLYGTRQLLAQGRYAASIEICLKQPHITDECLSRTYNDTVAARKWATFLKQEHLGGL